MDDCARIVTSGIVAHMRNDIDPTYQTMHKRLRAQRGVAEGTCACGRAAGCWSYDRLDPDEINGLHSSGHRVVYSRDVDHYVVSCKSCNMRRDHPLSTAPTCKHGHDRDTHGFVNVRPTGRHEWTCRECLRAASRRSYDLHRSKRARQA